MWRIFSESFAVDSFASVNNLSEDEIFKVIDLVENYLARRIVCNMPGNALTQVFCALHKDVLKSIEEYSSANVELDNSYSDILTYHIMRRDGNYQLPRDTQFVESIKTRDTYHMLKPFQIFLFERLENSVHGEYNDVATDMKKKDATIEHIMPQTLNGDWKAMLGDNYEEIQDKYLHTFANLTLTGINSELSNKPFEIKRDGKKVGNEIYPGYKNSKYRLTKNVTLCDKWTEIELQNRCNEIVATFLRLYPLPQTTFKPLPKPVDEASLDEETFSPTNRNLKGFRLFGNEYNETTWKGMLLQVVKLVMERYTDIVDTLYDAEGFFWSAITFILLQVQATAPIQTRLCRISQTRNVNNEVYFYYPLKSTSIFVEQSLYSILYLLAWQTRKSLRHHIAYLRYLCIVPSQVLQLAEASLSK